MQDADGTRGPVDLNDLHSLINATRNDRRHQELVAKQEGTEHLLPRQPQPQPSPAPVPLSGTIAPATPSSPQPAPLPAPAPAPAPVPAPPVEEPEDTHVPIQPDANGRLPQIKVRPRDSVDQTALILSKTQNKPVTDLSIINAARAVHNLPPLVDATATPAQAAPSVAPAPAPAAPAPAPAPAPTPSSVSALDAQIEAKFKERTDHNKLFDFEQAEVVDREILALQQQRAEAMVAERTSAAAAEQTRNQQFAEVGQRMAQSYPALANPQSELTTLARVKQSEAIARQDPLAWDPRSVEIFAHEAARELGIQPSYAAPASAPAPAPAPSPVVPVPTPQSSVRPPGSQILSSGGPQAPASTGPAADGSLPRIETAEDVHALIARARGTVYGGVYPANR